MARYRIVCTEQEPVYQPTTHAHIVAVGTGTVPSKADKRWTLEEVIRSIRSGNDFYTISPSTNRVAKVQVVNCPSCRHEIIRSTGDVVKDNNLDYLRRCNF